MAKFVLVPSDDSETARWTVVEVRRDFEPRGDDTAAELENHGHALWTWRLDAEIGTRAGLNDATERNRLLRLLSAVFNRGRLDRSREVAAALKGLMNDGRGV